VTITTTLLVPAGILRVTDTWQPFVMDDLGPVTGWWHTLRTARLNGTMIWWQPATADLLDAAALAIDGELRAARLRSEAPG
jgi:hypothetical protein